MTNCHFDDVRLKRVDLAKGISLTQMNHLERYYLGVADVMDYHDLRLTKVEVVGVLEIGQRDDFANVTWVVSAKGIPPRMNHRDDVRLMEVALAWGSAQARVGQVDAGVL